MVEYEQVGHMTKLNNFDLVNTDVENSHFPHHIVTKAISSTTKYRVVLNASCKDDSNISLNDHVLLSPVIQPELFPNVVRFRKFLRRVCVQYRSYVPLNFSS